MMQYGVGAQLLSLQRDEEVERILTPDSFDSDALAEDFDADQSAVESERTAGSASSVLVGIPAYNEEAHIGTLIGQIQEYTDHVVVVDDGSTDRTAEVARTSEAHVIDHDENRGKGAAIISLLKFANDADCDALVMLDGDGQHFPKDIPDVVEPVLQGEADVVIGSRYLEFRKDDETPLYRRVGQRILDGLVSHSCGVELSDTQSGFRALSPRAISELSLTTNGYGIESEMIADAVKKGLTISEQPIDIRYAGLDGQTYNPVHHGLTVVVSILRLMGVRRQLFDLRGRSVMRTVTPVTSNDATSSEPAPQRATTETSENEE